jgi:sacsin
LPFSPEVNDTLFVQIGDRNVRDMLCSIGIASWPTTEALLENYLLPSLTPEKCDTLPDDIKVQTLELVLHSYLSIKSQRLVSTLPIVPVDMIRSRIPSPSEKQIFRPMSELIDPEASVIKGLFFPDELLYPHKSLLDRFSGVMQQCGLRSKLTWELTLDRLQIYAATGRPLEDVEVCVRALLQLPIAGNTTHSVPDLHEVTDLEWIVAKEVQTQQLIRLKPSACMPAQYRLVVGRVSSVLEYKVHPEWEELLAWHDICFRPWVLEKQLRAGIDEMDMDIVNGVLTHISERGFPEKYVDVLRPMSCVLGRSGKLFPHTKVFLMGARRLCPYLDVVETRFLKQHKTLLEKLGVVRQPGLDDLLRVQEQLVVIEQPLSESLTAIAIEVVICASSHDRGKLTGLKIPDQTGTLQDIENVSFWDMKYSSEKQTTPLVHPKIPPEVVQKLAIGKFSDKILMKQLGIHDQEDEDEYYQHEDTTSRIADTLRRYSIISTFNEYLANAEDAEATRIDWLLDDGSHPTEKLICTDLQAFQGPALFVHNDGIFEDYDFEGFKKVGRGSKREEQWAIGQFGRGAQTMYHWTDVPMLISGKYFLILDPQEEFLPLNLKHGRRKPGLKLELSKLRERCPHQLAPFDGLWDYDRDLEEYKGTIFRFPLRPQGTKSKLTESTHNLGLAGALGQFERYFSTARVSLLFLQNVTQITFGLRQAERPQFRLERSQPLPQCLVEVANIQYHYTNAVEKKIQGIDEWRLSRQDIPTLPKELQELQGRVGRGPKYLKCGIAAPSTPFTCKDFEPSIFSTLPLPFKSSLPVHINASFALSGDRQNILVEETSSFEGSKWNKWLLQESIPNLYLLFLEDLARVSADVFRFWPTAELSNERLSDFVRTSFWEKIPSSRHRLYPQAKSIASSHMLKTGRGRASRKAIVPIVSWQLGEALFDFLCTSSPHGLQDLVCNWFPNIVRVSDKEISRSLKALAPCQVTPAAIREKLRTAEVCIELENSPGRASLLRELFHIIRPTANQQWKELDGCRILPLQNRSLGTIHLTQSGAQTYFCVTAQEKDIFGFASKLFMRDEVKEDDPFRTRQSTEFLQWLVESSAFNIRDLTIRDLKEVLPCRSATDWAPGPALETWLNEFWRYFNLKDPKPLRADTTILVQCGIDNFPIFRATKSHETYYISPKEYGSLPAVPQPSDRTLLELCQQFPDLYIVNRRLMPPSFAAEPFFPQFLTAISTIASKSGSKLETLIGTLNKSRITVRSSSATPSKDFLNLHDRSSAILH